MVVYEILFGGMLPVICWFNCLCVDPGLSSAMAKSSTNGLVGTGVAARYRLQSRLIHRILFYRPGTRGVCLKRKWI